MSDARKSERFDVAAGAMSPVMFLGRDGAALTVSPGSGGTMQVFKSMSTYADIQADLDGGSLSYANLVAGTQPVNSRWQPWASGSVTVMTNEGPFESVGDTAVVAVATTQPGRLEVAR